MRDLLAFGRSMRAARKRTEQVRLPSVQSSPAIPRASVERFSITWVGHSTNLIQIGGRNVLTDPIWSERASPLSFAGPKRLMPPGLAIDDLPMIDAVLLSHDHYDHADAASIRRLRDCFPAAAWCVPLGMKTMLARLRVPVVQEFDWWETERIEDLTVTCVPAQHFSGRSLRRNQSLWCGFVVAGGEYKVYFAGDTGWFPEFPTIAERCGPFDIILMPIGAYDPRWFMRTVHLDPEEAVRAYQSLVNGDGVAPRQPFMIANHWGTFKLTLEPLEEPPQRLRRAWAEQRLPTDQLWILAHGETRWLPAKEPVQP